MKTETKKICIEAHKEHITTGTPILNILKEKNVSYITYNKWKKEANPSPISDDTNIIYSWLKKNNKIINVSILEKDLNLYNGAIKKKLENNTPLSIEVVNQIKQYYKSNIKINEFD